jgi:hypothetical protein
MPNWIEENAKRDLWFKEATADGGFNCYFFPHGWEAEICQNPGSTAEEGELYGYAPTHLCADSPVYTMFVPASGLDAMFETTEAAARQLHPRLAKYLDDLDAGLDPDA